MLENIFKGGVTIVNPERKDEAMKRYYSFLIQLFKEGKFDRQINCRSYPIQLI